jgi:hypothetical protein
MPGRAIPPDEVVQFDRNDTHLAYQFVAIPQIGQRLDVSSPNRGCSALLKPFAKPWPASVWREPA